MRCILGAKDARSWANSGLEARAGEAAGAQSSGHERRWEVGGCASSRRHRNEDLFRGLWPVRTREVRRHVCASDAGNQ